MNTAPPAHGEKWYQRLKVLLKPPDSHEIAGQLQRLRKRLPGLPTILLILVPAWILSGIYIVSPDELGVVQRFGKFVRTAEAGPHYHLPYPIESVNKPKVTQVQRFEFGFRTVHSGPPPQYEPLPEEALMLTGDENILDLWFIVQFKIQNATDFLFKAIDPIKTVRDAAEAVMREVMGRTKIDEAMTTGRSTVQNDVHKTLQEILNGYACGIEVITVQLQTVQPPEPVRDAFKEVISAREEKNQFIHEAESYSSDVLPTARGLAVQIEQQAEGYRQEKIKRAQGETARFIALLMEYRKAKDVTRKRLYLEAMEEIVNKARKLIVDSDKQGILPLLSLDDLGKRAFQADTE